MRQVARARSASRSTCRRKDFRNRDVVDKVRDALASSGLAPHRLEIEVTETALLDDKSQTRAIYRGAEGNSACASRSTISAPAIPA